MTELKTDRSGFVPVGALDPRAAGAASAGTAVAAVSAAVRAHGANGRRGPTRMELIRGLVKQAPFVAKNFQLYFRNGWRRHVLHTKVVAPYAVTFYVTHKCNLDCTLLHAEGAGRFQPGVADGGDAEGVGEDPARDGFDRDHGRRADAAGGHRDDRRGGAIQE